MGLGDQEFTGLSMDQVATEFIAFGLMGGGAAIISNDSVQFSLKASSKDKRGSILLPDFTKKTEGDIVQDGVVKETDTTSLENSLDNSNQFYDDGNYLTYQKGNTTIEFGRETLENGDDSLFLQDIFTEPSAQGKGEASKILKEITDYADKKRRSNIFKGKYWWTQQYTI